MTRRDEQAARRAAELASPERGLYESFSRLGMSPAAALAATMGRDGPRLETDPLEELHRDAVRENQEAARRREVKERAERRVWQNRLDATREKREREAADYLHEVVDAKHAQEERLGLRPVSEGASDKRENLSRRRFLHEAIPPRSMSKRQRRRLRALLAKGKSLREALNQLDREGII